MRDSPSPEKNRRSTTIALRRRARVAIAVGTIGLAPMPACKSKLPEPVRVAAAADLTDAFGELGPAFERSSGKKVSFTFGATGILTKQIDEGAPFDVFAAANASYVDEAVKAGVCDGATVAHYGRGRVAIWTPASSHAAPPQSIADLADPRFTRIAIANPEHAPYGQAAKEALVAAGVWEAVKDRIVRGENVQETLALADTGNVEVALVSYSLVVGRGAADEKGVAGHPGALVLVDDKLHAPIDQALVVCSRGSDLAGGKAFAAFMASDEGRRILRAHGFTLPGDAAPSASSSARPEDPRSAP